MRQWLEEGEGLGHKVDISHPKSGENVWLRFVQGFAGYTTTVMAAGRGRGMARSRKGSRRSRDVRDGWKKERSVPSHVSLASETRVDSLFAAVRSRAKGSPNAACPTHRASITIYFPSGGNHQRILLLPNISHCGVTVGLNRHCQPDWFAPVVLFSRSVGLFRRPRFHYWSPPSVLGIVPLFTRSRTITTLCKPDRSYADLARRSANYNFCRLILRASDHSSMDHHPIEGQARAHNRHSFIIAETVPSHGGPARERHRGRG